MEPHPLPPLPRNQHDPANPDYVPLVLPPRTSIWDRYTDGQTSGQTAQEAGPAIGQTAGQTVPTNSQTAGGTDGQTVEQRDSLGANSFKMLTLRDGVVQTIRDPFEFYTDQQRHVLLHCMAFSRRGHTYRSAAKILGISWASVRNAVRRFERDGIAAKKKIQSRGQAWELEVDFYALDEVLTDPRKANFYSKIRKSNGQGGSRTDGQTADLSPPSYDRQKKNLSIKAEKEPKSEEKPESQNPLARISDSDFQLHWPHVHQFGFKAQSLQQVVEKLEEVGRSAELLRESLDFVEWELEKGPLKDSKGEEVKSPGFLFNALARTGSFRRPQGYVSPAEQAEIDKLNELKRIHALKAEREELEFAIWKADLSPELKQEILKDHRHGPEDVTLKNFWKKEARVVAPASQTPSS